MCWFDATETITQSLKKSTFIYVIKVQLVINFTSEFRRPHRLETTATVVPTVLTHEPIC